MAGSNRPRKGTRRAAVLLLYQEAALAADLLQRLAARDYEVLVCPVAAALERWKGELPGDLVLLALASDDDRLTETCPAVRARTGLPIAVLSDRPPDLTVARALDAGADEYVLLPVGDRELAARIDALLRRTGVQRGSQEAKEVGGFLLSPADLSVGRKGRRVFLTPTEFRLLSCLASAPGKVFTHETLMARVWGAEYVDARHYLHLYVRYLREKLEDDPKRPRLILSEWGVGYRLQPPEAVAR